MKGRTRRTIRGIWLRALLIGIWVLLVSQLAQADPHSGQSGNVAVIGGDTLSTDGSVTAAANVMGSTAGGYLPIVGSAGELGDFSFTALMPVDVDEASLVSFDTVVLNVASLAMACDTDALTEEQQADLVAFVAVGKKLIIYDSECFPGPVDYSWLPFPFSTANPGAMGAHGTLAIVEDNTLSSGSPADPHFVDASHLGTNTDAVGDMNVMTTYDPNWCVDMSGTNILGFTGPVHTYAKYPAGTDQGLIIYNGLDQDYQWSNDPWLRKVWVQELQQPTNPSNLPCGVTVVGITISPLADANTVGEDHTVTAALTDLLGNPQSDIPVAFSVISGPNAGATGTCSANSDCTTDVNGQVSFTYAGAGGVGTDEIEACFINQGGAEICSQTAAKEWTSPPNEPPDCSTAVPSIATIWPPNHKFVSIDVLGVTDADDDPVSIVIESIWQDEPVDSYGDGSFAPDGQGIGSETAELRAERAGTKKIPGDGRVYHIYFTADDGQGGSCMGEVLVGVPHDQRSTPPLDGGALYDSTQLAP